MEDQEILDQFLEHRQQNYVIDNMNAVAGTVGGGIGGVADVGNGGGEILGVKYDEQLQVEEHDVGDDDELKYVKEVQQSEKQQTGGKDEFGDYSSNELAENEEATYKYEIGNGAAEDVMEDVKEIASVVSAFANTYSNGSNGQEMDKIEEEVMMDTGGISQDLQSTIAIDGAREDVQESAELVEDEEASSLATNGTSSLSENVANPLNDDFVYSAEALINPKDTSDSLLEKTESDIVAETEQTHWQLNPEAKEFIPNFGSNPTSPISPHPTELEASSNIDNVMFFGQASMAVPRRIMVDDDFVAQSPRKGRCGNMDAISLPPEQEFDKEADQRPHELAQDDIELLDSNKSAKTAGKTSEKNLSDKDVIVNSTSNVIDHGPETSVDLDADTSRHQHEEISLMDNDVMKQSIYVMNDEHIEDVLNSVQPIPTEVDSVNNSFIEDLVSNDLIGDKEQLYVEEKEHISNSPSTEEMQVHLQSELTQPGRDIPQSVFNTIANVVATQDQDIEHQSIIGDNIVENVGFSDHPMEEIKSNSEKSEYIEEQSKSPFDEATLLSNVDEKHLVEDTKEKQNSFSDLEDKMGKITLNSDVLMPQVCFF